MKYDKDWQEKWNSQYAEYTDMSREDNRFAGEGAIGYLLFIVAMIWIFGR